MDILLLFLGAWWLSGVLGCRKRRTTRHRKPRKLWYDTSYRDDQQYRF